VQVEVFDGVALASQGDTILMLWKGGSRVHRLRWVFEKIEELLRVQPTFAVMQVILPSSQTPDADARTLIARELTRLRPKMRRLVTVPVGSSVRMSLVRAIIRAVATLTGLSDIQVIVEDVDTGIQRLLERAGPQTPGGQALADAMTALYAALAETPTAGAASR